MFLAFHHFKPADAVQILQNAVDSRQTIFIAEGQERSVPSLIAMFFSPLTVLFVTPLIRPFRWLRLLFTYLIPVIPLFVWWDGIVSSLRTYSIPELDALIRSVKNGDSFVWKTNRVKSGPAHLIYLTGIPKKIFDPNFKLPMTTEILNTTPDSEIVCTRIVNASQDLVFRAWSEPEHLKNWWGPAGFTNTFHEFDFQVGGKWNFTMHAPEQGNFENKCEFIKIEKPSLIAWKRHSKPLFQVLATFEEVSQDKTKVTFKQLFETPEECAKLKKYVLDKNEENMDRLEAELKRMKG
jgi:uncharacterized protein YndB with AHSA1/START domain